MILLILACASPDPEAPVAPLPKRPEEAPDVVVLSVSGHCFSFAECPDYNEEYLLDGALDRVFTELDDAGYSVGGAAFSDEYYSWVNANDEYLALGFLDLVFLMSEIHEQWMEGFSNPTKLVVIAHSHGTVWAHTALHLLDWVRVEVLVDLDGESLLWEQEDPITGSGDSWAEVIIQHEEEMGEEWRLPIWCAADCWDIPGLSDYQDVEDVVPSSVRMNLEVAASPDLYYGLVIQDGERNHRLDGSTRDIEFFQSVDDHGQVYRPNRESMNWVVRRLLAHLE